MLHVKQESEMHTVLWVENLKRKDCLEDLDIDGRILLNWITGSEAL